MRSAGVRRGYKGVRAAKAGGKGGEGGLVQAKHFARSPETHLEVEETAHLSLTGAASDIHLVAQQRYGHLLQLRLLQQLVQHVLGLGEALSVVSVNDKHYPLADRVAFLPVLRGKKAEVPEPWSASE